MTDGNARANALDEARLGDECLEEAHYLSDYRAGARFDATRAAAEIRRAESFVAACRPLL